MRLHCLSITECCGDNSNTWREVAVQILRGRTHDALGCSARPTGGRESQEVPLRSLLQPFQVLVLPNLLPLSSACRPCRSYFGPLCPDHSAGFHVWSPSVLNWLQAWLIPTGLRLRSQQQRPDSQMSRRLPPGPGSVHSKPHFWS